MVSTRRFPSDEREAISPGELPPLDLKVPLPPGDLLADPLGDLSDAGAPTGSLPRALGDVRLDGLDGEGRGRAGSPPLLVLRVPAGTIGS